MIGYSDSSKDAENLRMGAVGAQENLQTYQINLK